MTNPHNSHRTEPPEYDEEELQELREAHEQWLEDHADDIEEARAEAWLERNEP